MVVFTCNYCGDSVNKPKAEKHITIECKRKRYGYASLCCVDCLKDFDFRTYRDHTKCMTEEERYSAPGFVPKSSSCKGERKQASWIDTVSTLLEKPTLTKMQRTVLESICSYQNIPRKKAKFVNFMKSSAGYRNVDTPMLEAVFNLIQSAFMAANPSPQTEVKNPVKEEKPSSDVAEKPKNTGDDLPVENGTGSTKVKKKKKNDEESKVAEESSKISEPKESSSENVNKPGCTVNGSADDLNEDEGFISAKKSKKKKKEKNDDVPMEVAESDTNVAKKETQSSSNDMSFQSDAVVAKSRGKKKHKNKENISVEKTVEDQTAELVNPANVDLNSPVENVDSKPEKKKKKRKLDQVDAEDDVDSKRSRIEPTENETNSKFSWSNVVKTLLETSKDHEMSVKRMTKKVVAEYQSFYASDESFEEIAKKFNKKVKKLPFVVVSKDRIQLYVE